MATSKHIHSWNGHTGSLYYLALLAETNLSTLLNLVTKKNMTVDEAVQYLKESNRTTPVARFAVGSHKLTSGQIAKLIGVTNRRVDYRLRVQKFSLERTLRMVGSKYTVSDLISMLENRA